MNNPRPYLRQQDKLWWLKSPNKFLYMLRELASGLFIIYGFIILAALIGLACGESTFNKIMLIFSGQGFILLSIITLIFSFVHAFTWFALAPKAMPVEIAGRKIPDIIVTLAFYGIFLIICALALYYVLEF